METLFTVGFAIVGAILVKVYVNWKAKKMADKTFYMVRKKEIR